MKRLLNLFSVCVLLVGLSGVANAYIINYDYAVDGNNYTSPYNGVTVYTFESGGSSLPWSFYSGDANSGVVNSITTPSTAYAAPFGVSSADDTNYLAVLPGLEGTTGIIKVNFGDASYNYFGLWWGSVDWYNTIEFYNDAESVASFTGSYISSLADGNQVEDYTNFYVNFLELTYDSVWLISTNYSFEADNIAVGNVPVPEPMTMLLLGIGLVGLAGARRKFKK